MLDRLPPEIIDHILLEAAPPPRFDDFRQDSQETLSRCCMVSRLLRERAQPLLWRNVTLRYSKQIKAFLKSRPPQEADEAGEDEDEDVGRRTSLWQSIRSMRLQDLDLVAPSSKVDNSFTALLAALPAFLAFLEIDFDAGDPVTPFQLTELGPAASVLHSMSFCERVLEGATLAFPALVSLRLNYVEANSATFHALLSQSTLPALKSLILVAMEGDMAFVPLTAQFLSQLEVLETDLIGLQYIPDDLQQKPFALVIDWMWYEHQLLAETLSSSTTANLHLHLIYCEMVLPTTIDPSTVEDVVQAFSTLPRPRAFHFPHPPHPTNPASASTQSYLDILTAGCLANGIEVFGPDEDVWDVVKRMKAQKEKEEADDQLEQEK